MKLYKNIIVTFLAALVTIVIAYGGYTIYAADGNLLDLGDMPNDFPGAQSYYHKQMNAFFDVKLKGLYTLLSSNDDFYNHVDFKAPAGDYLTACTETNVSTYCVAMQALDMYEGYVAVLSAIREQLPQRSRFQNFFTTGTVFDEMATRNKLIDEEVVNAQLVMEGTIGAYDEFRKAYPMHKKFEQIIKTLIKYRIALRKIHGEAVEFPLRFIDASSSKCE